MRVGVNVLFILIFDFSIVKDAGGEVEVAQGKLTCDEGAEGVHKGHFHIPTGMVVRVGGGQSICQPALHMSQRSIFFRQRDLYVTEEHFFFVKGTLTYLALGILGERAAIGVGEGLYGPRGGAGGAGEAEAWCLRKWDLRR